MFRNHSSRLLPVFALAAIVATATSSAQSSTTTLGGGRHAPDQPVWHERTPPPVNPIDVDRDLRHAPIGRPDPIARGTSRGFTTNAFDVGTILGGGRHRPDRPIWHDRTPPPVNPIDVDRDVRHAPIGRPDPIARGGRGLAAAARGDVKPGHLYGFPVMHLPITVVPQPIGDIGETESLFLITSLAHYQQMFGERATGVDFRTEWAFLYSAGLEPTGGYEAMVTDVTYTPDTGTLVITTSLVSPGMNCAVPQIFTKPYMLVKFPKPPGAVDALVTQKDDQVLDCRN
jgi:hypothetical protein